MAERSNMAKTLTIRLSGEQVAALDLLATFGGVPVAHEIREAIQCHIDSKLKDEDFLNQVRAQKEKAEELLAAAGRSE